MEYSWKLLSADCVLNFLISLLYIIFQLVLYMPHNTVVIEASDECGHVKVDDWVFVQMLFERGVACYLQVCEE